VPVHPHLSIGEVLSLLHDEFPDITISKIRFLESQGLVDPERTPSGYRKFYEADIERLRWVLRQQRDAFLPLKVIKGRLEEVRPSPAPAGPARSGRQGESLAGQGDRLPPEDGGLSQPGARSPLAAAGPDGRRASPPTNFSAARQEPGPVGSHHAVPPGPPVDDPAQLFDAGPPYSAYSRSGPLPSSGQRPVGASRGRPAEASPYALRGGATDGHRRTKPVRNGRAAPRQTGHELGEGGPTFEDDKLTLEELVTLAGVDVETVRDLERFGLVSPRMVAGSPYYPREAATIAHLAASFSRHGVEARHLRAYKGAAEREAGLVQQVIMPLIRQRNPEARAQAAQAAEELSRLGGELRAALLRSALSDLR